MKMLLAINTGVFVLSAAFFIYLSGASASALGILDSIMDDGNSSATENFAIGDLNDSEAYTQYTYTAQPGDSYTLLARKATQTFGLKYDVSLSAAQIIYVETNLTLEAGSPELNKGQEVNIEEIALSRWIEQAKQLTQAEEAAWNYYVQSVDFNTDAVGETAD